MSKSPVNPGGAIIRRGSCLCQAVKYEIRDDPLVFRICHCLDCRKATGSAFMSNGYFMRHQVRVVKGEEKLKVYRETSPASGTPFDRQFCMECGSNVFMAYADPEMGQSFLIVAFGTMDDKIRWYPRTVEFPDEQRHWVAGIRTSNKTKSKL